MNTAKRYALILTLALLTGTALVAVSWAAPGNSPQAQGGAPTVVAYQGEVWVGTAPHTGDGYFKFAIVDAAGDAAYWSNDGTSSGGSEPAAAVQLAVTDGLFSVLLGDTSLGGMTQALAAGVFSQPDRTLRVWFSTSAGGPFVKLTPDTRIAAVPYGLQAQEAADADTVDGLHASDLATPYENVVVVARSGGDYTSVQAAIDSIVDASASNPTLVWVAPGVYSETVTMKPHVHLQGAGQEATVITSTVSSSVWPAPATLTLASDSSLRDLTVGNSGAGTYIVALMAPDGTTRALLADVTARAQGTCVESRGILVTGSGTDVTLQQVTALAENGSAVNWGLSNTQGAATTVQGGTFTARGGITARGIFNAAGGATLAAGGVTALGENGSNHNYGLLNVNDAVATLRGGFFTGQGGTNARGISNENAMTLEAEGITALGENGSSDNYGLENRSGSAATLSGGSFAGREGDHAHGIHNTDGGTTLEAKGVTALGVNGYYTSTGLYNENGAAATLRGGSYTGHGGPFGRNSIGIYNTDSGTTFQAERVTALGEARTGFNHGLVNSAGAAATLRGGSFAGRSGYHTKGIHNVGSDTTLEAERVAALGEGGSQGNFGLDNREGAAATLRGGSYTARGLEHSSAYGILSAVGGAVLEADNVTALAEDSGQYSYGLLINGANGSALATLRGGSYTAREGKRAVGMFATVGAVLEAVGVTALGENSSDRNYGMFNISSTVTLREGSLTGRGGTDTRGIYLSEGDATLEAYRITALGEDGTSSNYGLDNHAAATLRGGTFTGCGGTEARGIANSFTSTMMEADSITALAENGSNDNYGLTNNSATANVTRSVLGGETYSLLPISGAVTVSHSRLVGGGVYGTSVTCVLVTRGTTISTDGSTCP